MGGIDRLYPRVTIGTLPDDVLLEIFEIHLGKDDPDKIDDDHNYDEWQTLVHVCRRWRCIVFASPRRLDLKLYCTPQRSVDSKTLDIWPVLPIFLNTNGAESREDMNNVIAALRHHNRVCRIHFSIQFKVSLLEEFAAMDEPFPALTTLWLFSSRHNLPVLPESFLGGCAPRLRSIYLYGIPYPSIGTLLSSTTNLVKLALQHIPHSGYISPETIVCCLSISPRLESISLGFQYSRSRAHRTNRHQPPLTRLVFPNLTYLCFLGDIEYLEDILSQIETPMFTQSDFYFLNQLVFDTALLGHFIRRTETFMTINIARVEFMDGFIQVILEREEKTNNNREVLHLEIKCKALDWQLSAVAQILNSFSSSLPALETLNVVVSHEDFQDEVEVIQWREFLHLFTSVKTITLRSEDPVQLIAPALQEFGGERATQLLPALQNLFLKTFSSRPSGSLHEAIERFIAARQFYGQPVILHYHWQDTRSEEFVQRVSDGSVLSFG